MTVGRIYRGERAEERDPVTGNRLVRVSHHAAPDVACYYTNNGWLSDGRRLVFTSLRSGAMNFYLADCEQDEIVQLTDHPSLNVRRGSYYVGADDALYYWRTPELVRLDLDSLAEAVIWEHPPGAFASIPAVNLDATLLIATVLEHPELPLARVMANRTMDLAGAGRTAADLKRECRAAVHGIDLATGAARRLPLEGRLSCGCSYAVWSPVDPHRAWLGVGREANPGPRILVLDWDGADGFRCRDAGPRTDAELFDHVLWSADGRRIMFKYVADAYGDDTLRWRVVKKNPFELGWVAADDERGAVTSAPLPFRNTHVNHVPGRDWLIGDGGFERPAEQHVYRIDIKPTGCEFTSLAWHGNRFDRAWPYFAEGFHEPNVKANRQGTAISFTCSREGISPDVYVLVLDGGNGEGL